MRTGLSASVASHVGYVNQAFGPRLLFQNGEQGWWYDPSDFSTLFQDAAGTTPVTAVEQPCGLMLDKRLGLVLGSELVTNGTFDSDIVGWTATSGAVLAWNPIGAIDVTRVSTATDRASQQITCVAGKIYRASFSVTAGNNTANMRVGTTASGSEIAVQSQLTAGAAETVTFFFTATTTNVFISLGISGNTTRTFDNISVRELPGNHAYTPAAASTARPTVSARVNQLVATEDFTNVAWSKGSGVSATATTLTFTTGGATQFVRQSVVFTSGITYKILVRARSISGNTSLSLDLENAQSTAFTLTSALQNFEWVVLASGNRAWLDIQLGGAGSIEITAIDVRVANDGVGIPAYQRVNTATDYDSSGFPVYLRADGSNDYLLTNSIDFTGTDKMTLCAGVRKLSDAQRGNIIELGNLGTPTNGSFFLNGPLNATTSNYSFASAGTSAQNATYTNAAVAAPVTSVVTGIGDISGDSAILRINGVQTASNTGDQGTGNFGNHAVNMFARAGSSLFFNGRFYGGVVRGAQSNDQQISALEGYINNLTKAY